MTKGYFQIMRIKWYASRYKVLAQILLKVASQKML